MLSWLFNTKSADGRSQEELDRALADLNRQRLESGRWDQPTFDQAEANRAAGQVDVDQELNQAFSEGWKEGGDNIRKTIGGTINEVIGSAARIIPWQLWIAAGVMIFFYIGGPALLKGSK